MTKLARNLKTTWSYRPKPKNSDGDDENELIRKVIALMSTNGFKVWRQPNTGQIDALKLGRNVTMYCINTFKDLLLKQRKNVNEVIEINEALFKKDVGSIVGSCFKAVTGGTKGIADIIGYQIGTGRFIGVEIKIGNDKLSEHQIEWSKNLRDGGGLFFVAKDYDSFKDAFLRRIEV
jgi:VRR-NUC domain